MATLVDLEAYFQRIGYSGPRASSVDVLHALAMAHVQAIPFENLDVLLGRPIKLDAESLQEKLVHKQRGGYCFEQNGLFLLVLESLGFDVTPLGARVRFGRQPDEIPPRTHLLLHVKIDDESWLVDVGFGGLSLTCAIRLVVDTEQPTPHETRRLRKVDGSYYHQAFLGDAWQDVYEFTLDTMPLIDREVGNWYTSTHPQSHFRHRLMAARAGSQGARLTLSDGHFSLRGQTGEATKTPITSREELTATLRDQFGLVLEPGVQLPFP